MKTEKHEYDDGLEWLREIRREIARKCDYDPRKLGEYYRRFEEKLRAEEAGTALREKPDEQGKG